MSKKRFAFNDEKKKNSYGFYIQTAGINLTRFNLNPVCLNNHLNWTEAVIGNWIDLSSEEGVLSGEPVFDEATESLENKETIRKAKAGFIKGCSMGISFDEADFIKLENGDLILTKCELFEVSLVAVPSNASSVTLYDKSGNKMSENEVKTLCLSLGNANPIKDSTNNNDFNMKKIQLSLLAFVALGFAKNTKEVDEAELQEAVLNLKADFDTKTLELKKVTDELQAYKDAEKLKLTQETETMVNLAIQEGRITADKKQTFVDLAAQNFALAKATLETFEKKIDLTAGIQVPGGKEAMTEEKWQTLDLNAQLSWKAANPEEYKKLFS